MLNLLQVAGGIVFVIHMYVHAYACNVTYIHTHAYTYRATFAPYHYNYVCMDLKT